MFKFGRALLLAVGAVAVDNNCCTLYEDLLFKGKTATLCYASPHYSSIFDLREVGIESVGSIDCGENIVYSFCQVKCTSYVCKTASFDDPLLDQPKERNWVRLEAK